MRGMNDHERKLFALIAEKRKKKPSERRGVNSRVCSERCGTKEESIINGKRKKEMDGGGKKKVQIVRRHDVYPKQGGGKPQKTR